MSSADAEREHLVTLAHAKPVPPYTLDEQLTFFCPQENLEALGPAGRAVLPGTGCSPSTSPSTAPSPAVLLLPCQAVKPYTLSPEHRAVNAALAGAGYLPEGARRLAGGARRAARCGPALQRAAARKRLPHRPGRALRAVRRRALRGDLPLARRALAPAPATTIRGCSSTAGWAAPGAPTRRAPGAAAHGTGATNERVAFAATHNRLSDLMARELTRLAPHYAAIVAYIAPGLTHRSFLSGARERKAGRTAQAPVRRQRAPRALRRRRAGPGPSCASSRTPPS